MDKRNAGRPLPAKGKASSRPRAKVMSREAAYIKSKARDKAERDARTRQVTGAGPSMSSSSSSGPISRSLQQTRAIVENPHPYRYKSFNDRLAAVHISATSALTSGRGSTLAGLDVQGALPSQVASLEDIEDAEDEETRAALLQASTAFGSALNAWRELNLTIPLQDVLHSVQSKSLSLPLILHHRSSIIDTLTSALTSKRADAHYAFEPVLDLIPRLALDLGSEFMPVYPTALASLLHTTTITKTAAAGDEQAAARLVEKAFEAIAALFRNVAPLVLKVPSDSEDQHQPDWLQKTWIIIRPFMGWNETSTDDGMDTDLKDVDEASPPRMARIPSHVRRFASETFAHLLRRSKQIHLHEVAALMLKDVQEMMNQHSSTSLAVGVAGIWSEVTKSVDRRLHSQVAHQLSSVLLIEARGAEQARNLVGKLLVTSLIHHGHSTHLVPLFELLIEWVSQHNPSRKDSLTWLSAAVGTRKGTRIDDSVKPALFDLLLRLSRNEPHDLDVVTLLMLAVPSGRIPDLVGPGIKIVDALRSDTGQLTPAFNTLVLALAAPTTAWSGFSQFALPQVLAACTESLKSSTVADRRNVFVLLSQLREQDQLASLEVSAADQSPITARWRRSLADALTIEMAELEESSSGENALQLDLCIPALDVLALISGTPAAENITALLRSIVSTTSNHPQILASASAALADIQAMTPDKDVASAACSLALAQQCFQSMGYQRQALAALLRLFRSSKATSLQQSVPTPEEAAEALGESLMSEDEILRRAATGWVALCADAHSSEVAGLCHQMDNIENTPLRVDTSRDRNVRLRALARDLAKANNSDSPANATLTRTISRYVIGTLKLNLAPLWSESRKALADLGPSCGDHIWDIAFAELAKDRTARCSPDVHPAAIESEASETFNTPLEEVTEADYSDPQRSSRENEVTRQWQQAQDSCSSFVSRIISAREQAGGRLDAANYRDQLLLLFSELPSLVEKHNRVFMDHFFARIVDHFDDSSDDLGADDGVTSVRARLERLSGYLRVFTKFNNPKALYRSSDLRSFLYRLLAMGEQKVQRLALDCVMKWKDAALTRHEERLYLLLDQSRFRDQLASFDLSEGSEVIQLADRDTLMPVIIRLLYGLSMARKTSASASGRRPAILNALSNCSAEELSIWVELMSAAFNDQHSMGHANAAMQVTTNGPRAYVQQQNGFLGLLADCLKHLGAHLLPYWPTLLSITINLAHHSSLKAVEMGPGKASGKARDVRQNAIRRIADFFRNAASEQFEHWDEFCPSIFSHLVSPRLKSFAAENSQSPSALLELFGVWSMRPKTMILFVEGDATLLPRLYETLAVPSVKPIVTSSVLDIIERLIATSEPKENEANTDKGDQVIKDRVLKPFVSSLIINITPLMQHAAAQSQPDAMLGREISILARLATFVERSEDATTVLDLLGPMMRKSNRFVPEKSKADLLATFRDLLLLTDTFSDPMSDLFGRYYDLFSSMWSRLRSRGARVNLGGVFKQIALTDPSLQSVADWVESLNSYSVKRLDEPDFDRRLDVFDKLTDESVDLQLSLREWQPLLHNMLFFVQDVDELVIRSNASAVLRRFVGIVASAADEDLHHLFTRTAWPVLRKILKSRSEIVRKAVLPILDGAVKAMPDQFAEMHGLLAGGDEEANFFNNIHHIQAHRRARALRRLSDHAETGVLRSKTLSELFAPLVGHALEAGHTSLEGDHNLANETVICIGKLAKQMQWGAYNSLLWKYLRLADAKTSGEKVFVRTALSILDNFHFSMEAEVSEGDGDVRKDEESEDDEGAEEEQLASGIIKAGTADHTKVVNSVTAKLLPALMGYLEHHDDTTNDAIRLPIAVGVVRVVDCLPAVEKEIHLAKLLNVLANVFRSKSQETRDLARETLCKTAVALGPSRLPHIIREQKRSLTRGPQLAVLAYNVHSVLVHLMQQQPDGLTLLDQGVEDIIAIASEDLFGQTGEDREAAEYKGKSREQKHSKSLDTFEQVAKIVAPHRIGALLVPLRGVLKRTEVPRAVKAVEDALRRIASGINSNEHFDYATLLGLCHDLISRNAALLKPRKAAAQSKQQRAEVSSANEKERDHYAVNAYRFVTFGLDILITAMRRSRFDFGNADVLSRLDPLVADVGNTLYAGDGGVITLGLRAAGSLLRCSALPSLATALPVLTRQTTTIISREASASSDTAQAGIRVLTIMLRDCPQAEFKERQLAEMLNMVLPEIEEPNVQSAIFGFVRAIIGRRFVVPEVYDIMDKVAEMMVTNQSSQVRGISRAAFLQFLLDYPQGKGRLRNQMEFLAKNLSYVYESGRLSVMELLTAIFAKFSDDVLSEYGELLFVALVMVLANDDSKQCRERAAQLAIALISLVDETQRSTFVGMAHTWAERPTLSRVALQVYGLFIEAGAQTSTAWIPRAAKSVRQILQSCGDELELAEKSDTAGTPDWQLPYQALQSASKLAKTDSNIFRDNAKSARRLLLFPHSWVRAAACRFLGSLFATTSPAAPSHAPSPLDTGSLVDAVRKMTLQMRSETLDDALSLQIVKNLLWIGKSFAYVQVDHSASVNKPGVDIGEEGGSDEDEDDDEEQDEGALENPLAWLFSKLSHQARRSYGDGNIHSPTAILRWFAAMAQYLEPSSRVEGFLPHVITPLFRIMDEDVTTKRRIVGSEDDARIAALKTLAAEVQDLIQEKVGTAAYSSAYSSIRSGAMEVRRQRKASRLMRGIEDPEGEAKRKRERNEAKHQSRKRKNQAYAGGKGVSTTRVVKRTKKGAH